VYKQKENHREMEYHGDENACVISFMSSQIYFLQFARDFSIVAEITSIATLL
jgi:hypothetical protein